MFSELVRESTIGRVTPEQAAANAKTGLSTIVGAFAYVGLPVSQFPDIVPPTVTVSTNYPGASAETVADTADAAPGAPARPLRLGLPRVGAGRRAR